VRLEGLFQLEKFNDFIGNRSRYLPVCSIVPQPTMLQQGRLMTVFYLVCEAIGTAATPGLLCQLRAIVKMIVDK
jgi:hypothetical protein